MERRTLLLLILGAVAISVAAAWITVSRFGAGGAQPAPGVATERALEAFHAIEVNGVAQITLVQGTTPSIRIEASDDAPVSVRVRNGRLLIDSTRGGRIDWRPFAASVPRPTPQIEITFGDLDRLDISGTARVKADGVRVPKLAVEVSGAGTLDLAHLDVDELAVEGSGGIRATLAGRAKSQRIRLSGAGDLHAARLASDRAVVDVSGAGSVVLDASQSLAVTISGIGRVEYIGDPELTQSISGLGAVHRIDAPADARPERRPAQDPASREGPQHRFLLA